MAYSDDNLYTLERLLNIIADFADRVCNDVPLEGSGEHLTLTGEADVEIDSLLSQLIDAGVEGAAEYQTDSYKNVLRTDLLSALTIALSCNEQVIQKFDDQLSLSSGGETPRNPSGSPCEIVSGTSKECLSGYCLPGPHPNVGGSDFNFCVSAVKNCALPGGDGAMYESTYWHEGVALTCLNPNDFGFSGKWAQFFRP